MAMDAATNDSSSSGRENAPFDTDTTANVAPAAMTVSMYARAWSGSCPNVVSLTTHHDTFGIGRSARLQ